MNVRQHGRRDARGLIYKRDARGRTAGGLNKLSPSPLKFIYFSDTSKSYQGTRSPALQGWSRVPRSTGPECFKMPFCRA